MNSKPKFKIGDKVVEIEFCDGHFATSIKYEITDILPNCYVLRPILKKQLKSFIWVLMPIIKNNLISVTASKKEITAIKKKILQYKIKENQKIIKWHQKVIEKYKKMIDKL